MQTKSIKISERKSRSGLKKSSETGKRNGSGKFNWGSYEDDLEIWKDEKFQKFHEPKDLDE